SSPVLPYTTLFRSRAVAGRQRRQAACPPVGRTRRYPGRRAVPRPGQGVRASGLCALRRTRLADVRRAVARPGLDRDAAGGPRGRHRSTNRLTWQLLLGSLLVLALAVAVIIVLVRYFSRPLE